MMIKKRRSRAILAEMNVVPYIDVMLVLLVIFMITAPLLTQGVQVNLPQAASRSLTQANVEPLIVSVDKQGRLYLNLAHDPASPLTPDALLIQVTAALRVAKQKRITRQVLVKGDKDVDYGQVMQAMAILQHAGAQQVGLMTTPTGAG